MANKGVAWNDWAAKYVNGAVERLGLSLIHI